MNARRMAGITALVSGSLLVVGLVAAAVTGPSVFGNTIGWPMGSWPMGVGTMGADHMGDGHMGNGMMGMGSGMMGFGGSGSAAAPIPGAAEVKVTAANWGFTPSEIRLPKGTGVNLALTNPSGTGVVHDFTVPALGVHVAANPGETKTIGLRNLAAGRYDAYCSVPGHAELGMRATVVVE